MPVSFAGRASSTVGILAAMFLCLIALPGATQRGEARDGVEPTFAGQGAKAFAEGRIIVKLKEDAPDRALEALNRRNHARVEDRIPNARVSVIDLPRDLPVEAAVRRYENSPHVEYAEPDFLLYPSKKPNDPGYPKLYGLNNTGQTGGTRDADIDAPQAWDITTGSSGVVVAVIDTGVQITHPDLNGNIWVNGDEISNNGVDDDGNGYVDDVNGWDFYNGDNTVYDAIDGDKHGTHVAGTIAAEGNNGTGVTGVNWRARIMPLKFIGPDFGYTSDAAEAIYYAIANGASISNNSWGGDGEQTLKHAITAADKAGHLFVAAAGNGGTNNDASLFYPASYDNPNIISVAATDDEDALAGFSNSGDETVDLGAPGVSVLSTVPGGYADHNGTSMAAPHVAGAAALLKTENPGFDDADLKSRILGTVDRKASLKGKTVTGGRLNAAQALGVKFTELSLSAKPRTLVFGRRTTLSGRLTTGGDPLGGRKVVIYQRPIGASSFKKLARVTTASNGTYSLSGAKPRKHTNYRARFSGDNSQKIRGSTSPARRVNARVRVTLHTRTTGLKLGRARAIGGAVVPDHAGSVTVTIKRNGDVISRKKVALNDNSRYRFRYKPRRPGTYAFFATYPKHHDHLGDRSPQKSFKVVR